jgi:hypothetical protein
LLASLAALLVPGSARAGVISPGDPIAGQSQLTHAHLWLQTMFNIPAANNPILDATGADAFRGQVGSVLYLAGSFGGATNRTITVDPGTTLFFPLVNTFADNTAPIGSPPTNLTAQEWLAIVGIPPATVQDLFLEINGQSAGTTPLLLNHRQTTDPNNPFTNVIQSPQNLIVDFGFDPTLGTGDPFDPASYPALINPTVVDGYWVGLSQLPLGTHTIRFGGTVENAALGLFSQDNTFTIHVTPEPTSLLLWGTGMSILGAGLFAGYRRRRPGRGVHHPEITPSRST